MNTNSSKLDASNQKRLESLRQKANEFKQKKETVRHDLSNLDLADGKSASKRITFDSSSSESEPEEKKPKSSVAQAKKSSELTKSKRKSKNLFDDDSQDESHAKTKSSSKKDKKISLKDDESDDDDDDDYDAKKAFESKLNLNEKTANKLLQLKSKYVNENSRFKIDDRFIESDSSESSEDEKPALKKEAVRNENDNDDEEEVGERPEDISEKKLKKEKAAALKILESITGKPIIARNNTHDTDSGSKSQKVKQMVRYDPSKDEHKIFEVRDSSDDDESGGHKKAKETEKDMPDTSGQQAEELVNEEKFYRVEANIKQLFHDSSSAKDEATAAGFQFSFDNVESERKVDKFALEDYNDETKHKSKSMPKSLEERFKSKYSSSSESEDEADEHGGMDEDDQDQDESPSFGGDHSSSYRKESTFISDSSQLKRSTTRPLPRPSGPAPKIDHFLPREDEKDIVEALKFFCRTTAEVDDDNLRQEWLKKRAVLVEECKKKHKRVLRKKSTFENKKILPWKSSSSSSSKNHKK